MTTKDLSPLVGERATATLISKCDGARKSAELLSRDLLVGIGPRRLLRSGPVELDAGRGWTRSYVTRGREPVLYIKTVTVLGRGCTFDWLLITPGDADLAAERGLERGFDEWWASFQLDAERNVAQGAEP